MMYRHNIEDKATPSRRERKRSPMLKLLLCLAVVGSIVLVAVHKSHSDEALIAAALRDDDAVVTGTQKQDNEHRVYRKRIVRDEIPYLNFRNIAYRELFNDSNYVQLSAARAIGIDPSTIDDPAECDALVPIFSTAIYRVDTMYHAKPYLMPETVLLLDYIAHRFNQLMAEHYPQIGKHKVIVTSALRTEQSERRLKRVNRNATDTSCHLYGTTFDLSAQRYEHIESGRDTVVDACKQMLALALYELRYEGLCYVKYERGSCFHITLRTTQYEGSAASELRSYVNPGSPDYLLTKAPPRPKPSAKPADRPAKSTKASRRAARQRERSNSAARQSSSKSQPSSKQQSSSKQPSSAPQSHTLTERERMSLENYERRGY
ncbi:MAG: hypothetical protein J6T88_09190 [Bacteroidales bacterium]|nr:hypothetical protein [Bacteroidales bacterium]